jgi:hypothetical protein
VRAFTFRLASKLGSIESIARSFPGARVWFCVRIQRQKGRRTRLDAGVAVFQGVASSCVGMLVRQVGPRRTESGGSQRQREGCRSANR